LLQRAGLGAEPAHCHVSVPPQSGTPLLLVGHTCLACLSCRGTPCWQPAKCGFWELQLIRPNPSAPSPASTQVTAAELQRLSAMSLRFGAASFIASTSASSLGPPSSAGGSLLGGLASTADLASAGRDLLRAVEAAAAASLARADPPPAAASSAAEMENARLRAELSQHVAAACARDLQAGHQLPAASSSGAQQRAGAPATAPGQTPGAYSSPRASPSGASPTAAPTASVPAAAALGGGAGGAAAAAAAAVGALQRALVLKDDLAERLQAELTASAARARAYEARIAELEARLAKPQHPPPPNAGAQPAAGTEAAPATSQVLEPAAASARAPMDPSLHTAAAEPEEYGARGHRLGTVQHPTPASGQHTGASQAAGPMLGGQFSEPQPPRSGAALAARPAFGAIAASVGGCAVSPTLQPGRVQPFTPAPQLPAKAAEHAEIGMGSAGGSGMSGVPDGLGSPFGRRGQAGAQQGSTSELGGGGGAGSLAPRSPSASHVLDPLAFMLGASVVLQPRSSVGSAGSGGASPASGSWGRPGGDKPAGAGRLAGASGPQLRVGPDLALPHVGSLPFAASLPHPTSLLRGHSLRPRPEPGPTPSAPAGPPPPNLEPEPEQEPGQLPSTSDHFDRDGQSPSRRDQPGEDREELGGHVSVGLGPLQDVSWRGGPGSTCEDDAGVPDIDDVMGLQPISGQGAVAGSGVPVPMDGRGDGIGRGSSLLVAREPSSEEGSPTSRAYAGTQSG
jgi:hypothetical protein